jgi:hypothetical protein
MNCPRCDHKLETVSEYFEFKNDCLVRDNYCSYCKSVTIQKFYADSSYSTEWIDLNV